MYESIDIQGKEMVGRGAHCEVYKISEDRVLKLYFDFIPEEEVLKEQSLAQMSIEMGIKTAGVYDIYQYKNRLGLMFENIPTCTMTEYLLQHPDEVDYYAKEFAHIARKLHELKINKSLCNDYKNTLHERVNAVAKLYTKGECRRLHDFIDCIPDRDTLLHTDFHPGNAMVKGKELLLIDMADISTGHPVFDIASTYMGLVLLPAKFKKAGSSQTATIDVETGRRIWDVFIREYFGDDDREKIEIYEKCCEAITGLRVCAAKRFNNDGGETIGKRVVWYSRFTIFPKLKKYAELMKSI